MKRLASRGQEAWMPIGGLGLFLTQSKGGTAASGLTVKALAPGLPAAQSGKIQAGDRLVMVCGTPVADLEPSEAIALILQQQHERISAAAG